MKYVPVEVTGLDMAFGGKAMKILPAYKEIPDEFKRGKHPARDFASNWFFKGLSEKPKAKPGIDRDLALANLKACLVDFEPKHEHKVDGVAYLASLRFEFE
jgi:hypothetical protein